MLSALPEAEYSLLTTASELLWREGSLPILYQKLPLIVAVASHTQVAEVLARLAKEKHPIQSLTFVDIGTKRVTSATVRMSIRTGRPVQGILPSVWRYARKQWLYLPPIHR